jgi:hypothetical protein
MERRLVSHRLIAVTAGIVGAASVLFFVNAFGVNVPIADDWDHVTTSVHWHDRGIDIASLLAPHNVHCLAIPKLVNHATLKASGGNYRVTLFINAALAIAMLGVVLAFMERLRLPAALCGALAAAVALLLTSWSQWQNWLWAFQTPWFLLPLVVVAAAIAIVRARSAWVAVAVAATAALVGAFCMANGVFVGWALVPPLLLRLAGEPRDQAWQAGGAALVCIAVATAVAASLAGRSPEPSAGRLGAVLAAPLESIRLGLTVLGSPLDPQGAFHGNKTLSTIAGGVSLALGLAAAVAGVRSGRGSSAKDLGPGFALMVYGLASVAVVVMGRRSLLMASPVESRYLTFAIAWHVGTLLSCGWLAAERGGREGLAWRVVLTASSVACLVATLGSMNLFLRHGDNMRRALEEHQAIYRDAREPGGREKLQGISRHYGADGILERLDGMQRAGILHADYAPAAAKP